MARRTIGRRRSAVRLLLLLAAAGLALLPLARAAAHAELARAEPPPGALVSEPPRTVRLWFTERVEPRFTTVRVLDSNARQVDNGSVDANPGDPTNVAVGVEPLADGTYTVAWQALSAVDGHVTQGVYTFIVGEASLLHAPVEAAPPGGGGYPFGSAAVRWLVFLGAFGAVGGYVFRALVLSAARPAPEAAAIAARRWSALVWWWLGLAALASVAALVVQAAQAAGNPGSPTGGPLVFAIATGTAWGHVWLARMAFIGGLMAVTALSRWNRETAPLRLLGLLMGVGVALGLGLLASLSLASHAAAGSLKGMAIAVDLVHLAAGATWVGGLIALVVVALPAARALDVRERRGYLIGVVARFSSVALASVSLLVATGAVSAWLRVGSWGALAGTQYGLTLIIKLTLIGVLLLTAATNLLYVRPRLERGSSLDAGRLLRRLVVVEAGIGVAVLLATGALTALQPGRDAWARMERPLTVERTAGDFTVRLVVDPARLGANSYTATLTDAQGRPVTNAEARLRLTFLGADVAAQEVTLSSAGEGRYQAQGAELSLRGLWQALVAVQRPGDFDTQAVFRFVMPPTTPGDSEARLPRIRPTLGRRTILGLEVAVAGLVLLAIGRRLRGWALQAGALVAVAGLAVVAFGGFLAGRAQVAPEAPALASRVNPIPPDMESLRIGGIIYLGQCSVCHGDSGRGDGPQAASLTPPPLDLTVHVPLHPGGELFGFVARGVPGTAMPAFGTMFKDEEVWHLVNYLHQLADAAKQGAGAMPTSAAVSGARGR